MKEKEMPLEERIEKIFESGWVNEFNYLEQLMQETRSCLFKLQQELQRKDNNWKELKKWLNEPQITYNLDATDFGIEKIECVSIKDTLNKIKELESK